MNRKPFIDILKLQKDRMIDIHMKLLKDDIEKGKIKLIMNRKFTHEKSVYATLKRADKRIARIKLIIDEIEPQVSGKVPIDKDYIKNGIKKIKWSLDRWHRGRGCTD